MSSLAEVEMYNCVSSAYCYHGVTIQVVVAGPNTDVSVEGSDWRTAAVYNSTDQRLSVTRTSTDVPEAGNIVTPLLKKAGLDAADMANYFFTWPTTDLCPT